MLNTKKKTSEDSVLMFNYEILSVLEHKGCCIKEFIYFIVG